MTLYCDVDGTLLDSSARHEKLLRDLLAARGLLWPAAAPDYLRYKAELLRPRIAPGDVMLGDTEVDKSCAELLGLPWIVLDRGFRSAVYWQAHGVQPAHDLHEAARRLQNLP